MSKLSVSTRPYVAAHGVAPRGQGNWAFGCEDSVQLIRWFNGTFTQAKAALKASGATGNWVALP